MMTRSSLLLLFGLALSGCGETPPAPNVVPCSTFVECAADQICANGQCTAASELVIVTDALPLGKVGDPYTGTIEARGGSTPYVFALASNGTLPAGLSLDPSGAISGTPSQAGTASFTVEVTDAAGATASKMLFVGIKPEIGSALFIATDALPAGTVGEPYQTTLLAGGGAAPYVFSLASGALPSGLTIAPDGTLSGTPVAAGAATFAIQVSDASSPAQLATASFTLTINPGNGEALAIVTLTLPDGAVGVAYNAMLEARGGQPPYAWSLAAGTTLPSGLVLDPSGKISGAPTQEGTVVFSVRVADASQPAQEATAQLSIQIGAGGVEILTASLPDGEVGVAYSAAITAAGGAAPYSFSVATGSLPSGLQLSPDGSIAGTPIAGGTYAFTVQATDSSNPPQVAARAFSIAIVSGQGSPLQLTTATLPDAIVGTAYTAQLTASGGASPYSFSVDAGSVLPPGLNLSPTGAIDGTPTTAGRFNFTVTVVDSSSPQQSASAGFSILVIDAQGGLIITTSILPNGTVGTPYQQALMATGGTAPYMWSVIAGVLPDGLSVAPDGTISGTPSTAGGYNFTVEVLDAAGASAQGAFTLTINAGQNQTVVITTGGLPPATVGRPYSVQLLASGGATPYSWTLASGALPQGITLSTDGLLAGTASVAGSYSFAVQVLDSSTPANSDSRQYSLTVISNPGAGIALVNSFLPPARVGVAYNGIIIAAGGTAPYTFTVSAGSLPPGLTLATTGRITGTSNVAGSYTFTVRVSDSASPAASAQRIYTITVRAAGNVALLRITTNTLPPGQLDVPYLRRLNAVGGTAPYQWSVAAGALPGGLALGTDGMLSGTATSTGSFAFTAEVRDSSATALTASKGFTLVIQ